MAAQRVRATARKGIPFVFIAGLLGASWLTVYEGGGASKIPPHMVYLPVFWAGWRLGIPAAILVAVAGGVLTGPLLPAETSIGAPQATSDWVVRLLFFVVIGLLMSIVFQRWQADMQRAAQVARRERDLAIRERVFLESASHEIRTPLTVVMGVARTLEQRGMVSESGIDLLEGLKRSVSRLDRLCTMALASIGASEAVDRQPLVVVDLRDLMVDLAGELEQFHAARRLVIDIPRDSSRFSTEPRLLRPALGAVVENALKFSPPSSPVEITSRVEAAKVSVSIRDFGPGMTPDFAARSLDLFSRADDSLQRAHQGLGIGLFAAKQLVERLQGNLSIISHAERGTEIVFALPVPDQTSASLSQSAHRISAKKESTTSS